MREDRVGKPHAVFVNRVYPPDSGATGQILAELVRELEAKGWKISVVTTRGDGTGPAVERGENVTIHRVRGLPYRRKPLLYRALAYLSLYPILAARLFRLGRVDVLVVATDPPLFLVPGLICGRLLGAPVVHWVHDLYPDLAFATGFVREKGLLGGLLRKAMSFSLRRCAAVVTIGRCMSARLEQYSGKPRAFIPNWADTNRICPVAHDENAFRSALLKEGEKHIIMYSGNFGLGHPFDPIIRAMEELEVGRADTRFVLIGAGPRLPLVKKAVEQLGLRRVTFLPYQDYSLISASLGAADIHLVSMEAAMEGMLVPCKIYGVMAAGRPYFFLGPTESEAARIVVENQMGEVLAPARYDQLGMLLNDWIDHPDRLSAAGQRARHQAEAAGLTVGALAFDTLLKSLVRKESRGA
jgi:glycosyltransferase involved in cell wall biosynthesis